MTGPAAVVCSGGGWRDCWRGSSAGSRAHIRDDCGRVGPPGNGGIRWGRGPLHLRTGRAHGGGRRNTAGVGGTDPGITVIPPAAAAAPQVLRAYFPEVGRRDHGPPAPD